MCDRDGSIGVRVFEELQSNIQQRQSLAKTLVKVPFMGCDEDEMMAGVSPETMVPLDLWILAVLRKESIQPKTVDRILSRHLPSLPAGSTLFPRAVDGQGMALFPVLREFLR